MKLEKLLIGGLFFTCALTLVSCDNSKPTPVYIRGAWTTGGGYVDFNPTIS